jgi:chromosomal replication initiator protein
MQGTITDEQARTAGDQISAISEALAEKVGPKKFRIWFKNSTRLTLAGGYLKVGVPNLFIASWIENHFLNEISQAVQAATGKPQGSVKITFAIDPELAGQQRRTQLDSQAQLVERARNRLHSRRTKKSGQAGTSKKKLKLNLDTFVVGSSNELAYNAGKAVVNQLQSPFNPLFIHGGYGVGKTHLLQGICNAVCKSRPQTGWLYLSAEDFANQFVLALKTKKLEAFRRRMRQTDLLAIDDIHFLASKPIDLAGKQVVMVSDAHPKMIGQLSEKLVNRFISGMVVKIDNPDFQTRCQICRQYARQLMLDNCKLKMGGSRFAPQQPIPTHKTGARTAICESVIKYIAENLRTNVRELEGALLKLIAYSALQNEKINLSMAKAVLAEHLARTDPIVHISDIESAVATYFGLTPANIHSSKKNRTVALARHFSMYLTRKHTKMSSSEVGRFMGNKNHATVLLACKKIEDLLQRDAELNWLGPAGNKVSKARKVLAHLEESISR